MKIKFFYFQFTSLIRKFITLFLINQSRINLKNQFFVFRLRKDMNQKKTYFIQIKPQFKKL
ncbi:hypothetical protein TTHERM_000263707 (macronuclear) [Tetrahymena thermophila SB210]|uniref:Uncharacterized protein n=1 Tax=Tetrahymena thermophila (strain SB210) TaxID=312017 RepID=W7X9N7_TETTS|nr:hypothetical protein TTHERM_000263707 [Tetrahymena thermophila SB210]EWS76120.1 hypothetical protein TTHERM_000263707 [Tetrahymena thermophila SB210]|eukprot:XP_012651360.1 hypothetical protein TTHERM_000263707 [Tetrahymena thermophila SB210]